MPIQMRKEDARRHVGFAIDDSLNQRPANAVPIKDDGVVYVGWSAGFEPMFVAVWSYIPGVKLDYAEAEEIAIDLLEEIGWFANGPTEADYFA